MAIRGVANNHRGQAEVDLKTSVIYRDGLGCTLADEHDVEHDDRSIGCDHRRSRGIRHRFTWRGSARNGLCKTGVRESSIAYVVHR